MEIVLPASKTIKILMDIFEIGFIMNCLFFQNSCNPLQVISKNVFAFRIERWLMRCGIQLFSMRTHLTVMWVFIFHSLRYDSMIVFQTHSKFQVQSMHVYFTWGRERLRPPFLSKPLSRSFASSAARAWNTLPLPITY